MKFYWMYIFMAGYCLGFARFGRAPAAFGLVAMMILISAAAALYRREDKDEKREPVSKEKQNRR